MHVVPPACGACRLTISDILVAATNISTGIVEHRSKVLCISACVESLQPVLPAAPIFGRCGHLKAVQRSFFAVRSWSGPLAWPSERLGERRFQRLFFVGALLLGRSTSSSRSKGEEAGHCELQRFPCKSPSKFHADEQLERQSCRAWPVPPEQKQLLQLRRENPRRDNHDR